MTTDTSLPKAPRSKLGRDERRIDFRVVWLAARKRPELLLAIWLSVVGLSVFYTLGTPKTYRAESMLRLDPAPPRPLGQRIELVDTSANIWARREFYLTEVRVIRSMRVATAVVRLLGLNADPVFMRVPMSQRASFKPVPVEDAARVLIDRIVVDPVKESSIFIVQYEDTDKKACERILNTLVRTYLSQNLEASSALSASASDWLNGQLANLKSDLEKSEIALNQFREKNDILTVALEDRNNITTNELEQISKDLLILSSRKFELEARAAELRRVDLTNPESAGVLELLQSLVLNSLRQTHAEDAQKLEELLANAGEENPKVLALRAGMKKLESSIRKETENIKSAAEGDVRRVDTQIRDLKAKDAEIRKQAHELQALAIPYNQLNRTKTYNEKIYSLVLERARETDLTRMVNINNIRVIDEAIEPSRPFKPNAPLTIGGGVALGLLIGLSVTLLRDVLDRTLKTPGDVEEYLGMSCLGLIPAIARENNAKQKRGRSSRSIISPTDNPDLIVATRPESSVAEALRAVRTNLMFMSPDRPYCAIGVTSALPSEGKTTVACALAIVLAQSGLRVLLVDTDLRRPRLHRSFRMPNDVGVSLACTGQVALDECVRETDIPCLSVLTSGPIPPNPAEMLHSDRFAEIVTQLRGKFDRIIFDSPPVLPVTDAAVLARLLDGVVLVARGFKTDRNAVGIALRQLLDVNTHIVGVIINAVDLARRDYKGYYYYYRREGYYKSGEESVLAEASAPPSTGSTP
jgi:capsular exopolysaccharide synthesis family protein